ncbi:unnamed protein product, partial [Effrenium voratum]
GTAHLDLLTSCMASIRAPVFSVDDDDSIASTVEDTDPLEAENLPQSREAQVSLAPEALAPYSDRLQSARKLAEELRAKEPLLGSGARTVKENPDFVQTFFKASRLHFIGVWRERYEEILDSLPPAPKQTKPPEVFMHIDMDCFFASVATLGRQHIFAGLPVAVAWGTGSSSEISSANYAARAAGVRAGMWAGDALRRCPDLVIMPYEFSTIMEVAEKFYRTVLESTPYVQGISCDEVFADTTKLCEAQDVESLRSAGQRIRDAIFARTGCRASVGVAKNRLLARLATKQAKPSPGCPSCQRGSRCLEHPGVCVLESAQLLEDLPVRDLPSVGPESEKQLHDAGVFTVSQLRNTALPKLQQLFGPKQARCLHALSRGLDERPWDPRPSRKSVGAQIAWGVRFESWDKLQAFVVELTEEAFRRLRRHSKRASSITVKAWRARPDAPHLNGVGSGGCDVISRSAQLRVDAADAKSVQLGLAEAWRLFGCTQAQPEEVRGVGVHLTLAAPGTLEAAGKVPAALSAKSRIILHLDVDCFFLSVHRRYDPSLKAEGLVLWQYNDVICISPEAKAAGVRKHMRPSEAQRLVQPIGGQLVHAFTRRWPGPRVWYGPYQSVSREIFAKLQEILARENVSFVLERISVDEAFLDVTGSVASLAHAAELAQDLARELKSSVGVSLSAGVACNKLLAKLGSVAAKPPKGSGCCVVDSPQAAQRLLAATPAPRVPGLGAKAPQLEQLQVDTAADLQRFDSSELAQALGLAEDSAARIRELAEGKDEVAVKAVEPKKSLVVTSWLSDGYLHELATKTGADAQSVTVGDGWVFHPQLGKGVTNLTRVRWLLLALVLDLEERTVQEYLEHKMLPTKLCVSYQGPGWRKEPGPGSTDGKSCSRSGGFPTDAFRGLTPEDGKVAGQIQIGSSDMAAHAPASPAAAAREAPAAYRHPVYGTEFLTLAGASAVLSDGPEILQGRRGERVGRVVDAACGILSRWAGEFPDKVPLGKLTLTASCMMDAGSKPSPQKRRSQTTLADCFKKTKLDASPAPRAPPVPHSAFSVPAFEVSDSE